MDIENKVNDTAEIPEFDSKMPSESLMAAMNLRELINKLEGEDRCVVCQAIKELEKKDTNSSWSAWLFPIIFLLFGNFDMSAINLELLAKSYLKTIGKFPEESEKEEK